MGAKHEYGDFLHYFKQLQQFDKSHIVSVGLIIRPFWRLLKMRKSGASRRLDNSQDSIDVVLALALVGSHHGSPIYIWRKPVVSAPAADGHPHG